MAIIVARKRRAPKPGRWIDPDTWQGGKPPTEHDDVVVPKGIPVPWCNKGVARCKTLTVWPEPIEPT